MAEALGELLVRLAPATLLVPWRRDPHCDHEATWQVARNAVALSALQLRWLEYPVWAWTKIETAAAPQSDEARAWRLDISPVLARKAEAIRQHRSQLGGVIQRDRFARAGIFRRALRGAGRPVGVRDQRLRGGEIRGDSVGFAARAL